EFFASYSGEYDMEEAVRLVKRNSRRFAKRQVTWFKRYKEIEWFNPKDFNAIVAHTKDLLAK
ncbi:MAG: tRNA dimethylallyltransferase, partial [Saprospiraceae bacterium]